MGTVINLSHDAMMRLFKISDYRKTLMAMMKEVTKRYEEFITDKQRGSSNANMRTATCDLGSAISGVSNPDRRQFKSVVGAALLATSSADIFKASSSSEVTTPRTPRTRAPSPVDEEKGSAGTALSDVVLAETNNCGDSAVLDSNSPVWWVIDHTSSFKLTWDWIILIFVVYNAIYVPYAVAFIEAEVKNVIIMNYIIDGLFGVDIGLSFITSFVDEQSRCTVYDPKRIRHNYLCSLRFVIDLAATIPFELIMMSLDSTGMTPMQLLQIKAIKCIRLLRLGKFFQKLKTSERLKRLMFGFR